MAVVFFRTVFILYLSSQLAPSLALRCHKCVSLECPHDHETCKNLERSVMTEADPYFEREVPPWSRCPPVGPEGMATWKILESSDSTCKLPSRLVSCVATRFQIELANPRNLSQGHVSSHEGSGKSFGTIMGCGSVERKRLFKNSGGSCVNTVHPFELHRSGDKSRIPHVVELEHCQNILTLCDSNSEDFCLDLAVSIPKEFNRSGGWSQTSWGFVGVAIGAPLFFICAYLAAEGCARGRFR